MSRTMREQMQADPIAVSVLRTTLAALSNAEAVDPGPSTPLVQAGLFDDVERRSLSADDITSIVDRERTELESTAVILDAAGRTAEAAGCRARAAVLDSYLAA